MHRQLQGVGILAAIGQGVRQPMIAALAPLIERAERLGVPPFKPLRHRLAQPGGHRLLRGVFPGMQLAEIGAHRRVTQQPRPFEQHTPHMLAAGFGLQHALGVGVYDYLNIAARFFLC